MMAPWSNDYYIQTKYKLISEHWSFGIEEGLCSAIHPTGLFMAIGFRDCFKVYAILSDGLSPTHAGANLRECSCLCYSANGHHLSVSSANSIYVYDAYSYEKLLCIPSIQNSSIRELKYEGDCLISKAKNGNCFIFGVNNNYSRSLSFYPKDYLNGPDRNINFEYVEYDPLFDVFMVSWVDQLKFYTSRGTVELVSVYLGATVTTIHICRQLKTMFIGTSNGEVICFPWPNNPVRLKHRHPKKKVHEGPIQFIKTRNDFKQIVVVSATGVLYIGKLRIVDQLREIKAEEVSY